MYRSNWEELPKYQALDELSTVNYQVTVTNTGSRSGATAVLAYMTFSVRMSYISPLSIINHVTINLVGSQCTNETAVWISAG